MFIKTLIVFLNYKRTSRKLWKGKKKTATIVQLSIYQTSKELPNVPFERKTL